MTHPVHIDAPAGLPYIDIVREFDAPLERVFAAHRDPETVKRWLGPDGYEMEIERWDYVDQGGYRYTHHTPDHGSFSFRGTFHTVRPELAIQTFEFEGMPDLVAIETLTLEPLDGGRRTRASIHSVYPSVESRDAMVQSGMETGVTEGYARLDDVLAEES
jgi:uncharacterized protein YndB with AHSA1/START domain